jgi:hypothetical protein
MEFLGWHFLSCSGLVIAVSIISCPSVGYLICWEIFLHDSCFSYELMGCRSNVVIFFRYSSHLHGFLCLAACLKRIFTFFIWQFLYTFCSMCWITVNNLACWFLSSKFCWGHCFYDVFCVCATLFRASHRPEKELDDELRKKDTEIPLSVHWGIFI